jgi:hypothetical protein
MIKFTMHEDFVIKQVSIIIVHCDSFQLFSWFQLFSSENCFPKVGGHDRTGLKKLPFWKEV